MTEITLYLLESLSYSTIGFVFGWYTSWVVNGGDVGA